MKIFENKNVSTPHKMPKIPHEKGVLIILCLITFTIFFTGCSDRTYDPGVPANPLSVYTPTQSTGGLPTDGNTTNVGAIDKPIVNTPINGDGRNDHTNAPLLNNWHPGWQQADCFSCHTDQSRIPDHNYPDTSLCYLCHGTNGLPSFGDNIPPTIKSIVTSPTHNAVTITWITDEPAITRIILRILNGDKMEFPVSTEFKTSHKFYLSGLLPSTTYEYEIIALDRNGNRSTTASIGKLNFTTQVSSPTTTSTTGTSEATTIFAGITITNIESFSARVIWQTTIPTTCAIELINVSNGTKTDINAGGPAQNFNKLLEGLSANTRYYVTIIAVDSNGNTYKSSRKEFTTKPL